MPTNYDDELRLAYLRAAIASQAESEAEVEAYRLFYDGDQGVKLTDRQKQYLIGRGDGLDVDSFGNICKRAVNVPRDRLELKANGIAPADPEAGEYAGIVTDWWNANSLDSKQKDVYRCALRDGSVAVIVGWSEAKKMPTFTPNLVYDGATGLVRFHYDNDDNMLFASKRWQRWNPLTMGETGKTRLNIYLDDRIERNIEDKKVAGGWRLMEPAEVSEESGGNVTQNPQPWVDKDGPLGIPVINFEAPDGSELADIITIQKVLNHTLGELDIAVDLHNWPILWGAGLELPTDSSGKPGIPAYGAGKFYALASDGRMGRIEPADLEKMFRSGILSWLHILAIVKGWPLFVLDRSAQPPSGVALKVMEANLVEQVSDMQVAFGGDWQAAFEMGRKLHRANNQPGELAGELELTWQSPETADEQAEMKTKAQKWEAGQIPIRQRWSELGYTPDQIAEMEGMVMNEMAQAQSSLGAALLEQQRQFDQGEGGVG